MPHMETRVGGIHREIGPTTGLGNSASWWSLKIFMRVPLDKLRSSWALCRFLYDRRAWACGRVDESDRDGRRKPPLVLNERGERGNATEGRLRKKRMLAIIGVLPRASGNGEDRSMGQRLHSLSATSSSISTKQKNSH